MVPDQVLNFQPAYGVAMTVTCVQQSNRGTGSSYHGVMVFPILVST